MSWRDPDMLLTYAMLTFALLPAAIALVSIYLL